MGGAPKSLISRTNITPPSHVVLAVVSYSILRHTKIAVHVLNWIYISNTYTDTHTAIDSYSLTKREKKKNDRYSKSFQN